MIDFFVPPTAGKTEKKWKEYFDLAKAPPQKKWNLKVTVI